MLSSIFKTNFIISAHRAQGILKKCSSPEINQIMAREVSKNWKLRISRTNLRNAVTRRVDIIMPVIRQ